jgi:nucleotide-binding universal stress UspA family protein
MKNILVAIDFSDASFNAISYAAFLANAFNTQLTLVHAFTDTSAFDEHANGKVFDSLEELEAANQQFLKKEIEGIARKFTIKINGVVVKGNPVKVINEMAEKSHSEIIIMGMKGKGESNSIFGSTTVSMIDKTSIPLLIIPKNALYQTIDSITFTSDFKEEKLLSHFAIIEKLIAKFNPFIQVLNVQKKNSKLTPEMIAGKMNTDLTWDKYNHSFNIIEKDDVEEGIFSFLRKHPTDLLVMIARKRGFINKMFEPSHTKKMTSQTKIPLLVLHK